jgi:hypothetical protein
MVWLNESWLNQALTEMGKGEVDVGLHGKGEGQGKCQGARATVASRPFGYQPTVLGLCGSSRPEERDTVGETTSTIMQYESLTFFNCLNGSRAKKSC